jgi:hypothetical protein
LRRDCPASQRALSRRSVLGVHNLSGCRPGGEQAEAFSGRGAGFGDVDHEHEARLRSDSELLVGERQLPDHGTQAVDLARPWGGASVCAVAARLT